MKLYRFWVKESGTLQVGSDTAPMSCWGGSNQSLEEARLRAREKMTLVQERVNRKERTIRGDYEVEIREEILQELNPRNVVTRNRYGASVLNSEDTLFIDIDEAPWTSFFKSLFSRETLSKKQSIIRMVKERAQRPGYQGLQFRIYETSKGIRLLVTGRAFDPKSSETKKIFSDFNADGLYSYLCQKQNCFRARLSPKPYRIKCRAFKVLYPRTSDEQTALESWLTTYEETSSLFAVCRFVESVGLGGDNAVVSFHDSMTKAHKSQKLA